MERRAVQRQQHARRNGARRGVVRVRVVRRQVGEMLLMLLLQPIEMLLMRRRRWDCAGCGGHCFPVGGGNLVLIFHSYFFCFVLYSLSWLVYGLRFWLSWLIELIDCFVFCT